VLVLVYSCNFVVLTPVQATGTWQGIWYLEFRAMKHQRRIMATIQGQKA
jgi:thiamine phosphate synthase YjbQ (UPF0047 family)